MQEKQLENISRLSSSAKRRIRLVVEKLQSSIGLNPTNKPLVFSSAEHCDADGVHWNEWDVIEKLQELEVLDADADFMAVYTDAERLEEIENLLIEKPELKFRLGVLEYGRLKKGFYNNEHKEMFSYLWGARAGKKTSQADFDQVQYSIKEVTGKVWKIEDMEGAVQNIQRRFKDFPIRIGKRGKKVILEITD